MSREGSMLRSKPIMPKPALPFAKAWPVRSARRRQPGATRLCASGRKRRGRTSMQESRATGPTSLPSCCSEVYPDPPARPSHEREHDTLTRDASDKELLELRSRGRCDAALYNTIRPHSSIGYLPPAPEAILPRPAGLPYASLRSAHQGDHNRRNSHLSGGPV